MTETTTPTTAPKPTVSYRSTEKATWCPGCGHFSALTALDKALQKLEIPKHEIAVISGIGCSSRMPFFLDVYGLHSAHGRALPVATGLKLSRPDLNVIAVGGDGDALAIGAGHFMHAMRRNLNFTYLLLDNQIYGMTKGQTAPTSMVGTKTKSTPYGSFEPPIDPIWAALTMGATYVAQGSYTNLKQLVELIIGGINHRGTALVNVLSNCLTFYPLITKDFLDNNTEQLPADYDSTDLAAALKMMMVPDKKMPLGLIYQNTAQPALDDMYQTMLDEQCPPGSTPDIDALMRKLV